MSETPEPYLDAVLPPKPLSLPLASLWTSDTPRSSLMLTTSQLSSSPLSPRQNSTPRISSKNLCRHFRTDKSDVSQLGSALGRAAAVDKLLRLESLAAPVGFVIQNAPVSFRTTSTKFAVCEVVTKLPRLGRTPSLLSEKSIANSQVFGNASNLKEPKPAPKDNSAAIFAHPAEDSHSEESDHIFASKLHKDFNYLADEAPAAHRGSNFTFRCSARQLPSLPAVDLAPLSFSSKRLIDPYSEEPRAWAERAGPDVWSRLRSSEFAARKANQNPAADRYESPNSADAQSVKQSIEFENFLVRPRLSDLSDVHEEMALDLPMFAMKCATFPTMTSLQPQEKSSLDFEAEKRQTSLMVNRRYSPSLDESQN